MCTIINTLRTATQLTHLSLESRLIDEDHYDSTPVYPLNGHEAELPSSLSNLVTLPFLSHLSLRVNNMPSLLGRLVVPSLLTLYLDDLDGKRTAGAEETGKAIHNLLVRMGLQALGLVGVGIQHRPGSIWELCLKHMGSSSARSDQCQCTRAPQCARDDQTLAVMLHV